MYNSFGYRVLFDTNILLDAVVAGRPQSDEAWAVIYRCNGDGDKGFATSGSLKDVYYIIERRSSEKQARDAVTQLMDLLIVVPTGAEECLCALNSNEPDFEDGLIRACAELNDVDFILTRDAEAYAKSKVRAVTCAEYLEICDAADTLPAGW